MTNQTVTSENPTDEGVIDTPLGKMLTRKAAAQRLKRHYGFGSPSFIARRAMDGSGPAFHKMNATAPALYPIGPFDEWALKLFGAARPSFNGKAA